MKIELAEISAWAWAGGARGGRRTPAPAPAPAGYEKAITGTKCALARSKLMCHKLYRVILMLKNDAHRFDCNRKSQREVRRLKYARI